MPDWSNLCVFVKSVWLLNPNIILGLYLIFLQKESGSLSSSRNSVLRPIIFLVDSFQTLRFQLSSSAIFRNSLRLIFPQESKQRKVLVLFHYRFRILSFRFNKSYDQSFLVLSSSLDDFEIINWFPATKCTHEGISRTLFCSVAL